MKKLMAQCLEVIRVPKSRIMKANLGCSCTRAKFCQLLQVYLWSLKT